jgi:hypothetical protein
MNDSTKVSYIFTEASDFLIYRSYEYNRDKNPHILPEKWSIIYPNIDKLEQKYKEQKTLRKQ